MVKKEEKIIYCPSCGRRVAKYDGKSTINVIAKCKKCQKLVVYNIETGKIKLSKIPERNCSSGMIMY